MGTLEQFKMFKKKLGVLNEAASSWDQMLKGVCTKQDMMEETMEEINRTLTKMIEAKSTSNEKRSSESLASKSVDEGSVKKKWVSFKVDETPKYEADSSKFSSLHVLSSHGIRDILEDVAEIRDDFQIASSCGKIFARMLEVGKVPYHPGYLILSRILHPVAPSLLLSNPPSMQSINLASKTSKLAKSHIGDVEMDKNSQVCNLSSTLDKLYAWKEKLYKEVKEEEKLRVTYEKQCNRLKGLDEMNEAYVTLHYLLNPRMVKRMRRLLTSCIENIPTQNLKDKVNLRGRDVIG